MSNHTFIPSLRSSLTCGLLVLSAGCQLDVEPETAALQGPGSSPLAAAAEDRELEGSGAAGSASVATGVSETLAAAGMRAADPPQTAAVGMSRTQAGAPAPQPAAEPAKPSPAPAPQDKPAAQAKPPAVAGAAGAPAQAGAAGSPPPAAATTANAQVAAKSCTAGLYTGSFSGSLELIQLAALGSITGTIRAELTPDGAHRLMLRNARVVGVDKDQNTFTATLTGQLNCATHELENGKLESGSYQLKALATQAAFSGETTAMHLDDPPSAVGTWQATANDNVLLGGRGTWNLVLDEPSAR